MAVDDKKKSGDEAGRGERWLLFTGALVLGLPLLALCGLTVMGPPSGATAIFTAAVVVGVVGGLMAPWQKTGVWGVRAAFMACVLLVGWRFLSAGAGATVRDTMGPTGTEGRWIDRLVPERDVALGGVTLLLATGRMPRDQPGILDALRDGYDRMERAEGAVPSAVVGTFLFGHTAEEHTLLRIAPADRFNPPEAVVLFLHGFIGNVTLECWQVAQAVTPVGMDVLCPSTEWQARWANPEGRRIVEAEIAQLRGQGVRRIYLAGLSAGAIGASRLARTLDIDGLILISGASQQASPARVPTLVLQGALDRLTPAGPSRSYARRAGARATYIEEPDAGHWMILSHHAQTTDHLRRWLAEREGIGVIHGAPAN